MARLQIEATRLADYIRRTVDEAPPLSEDQRQRLSVLMRGGAA